ncbi:MAG: heme o synthase [Dehalococcoidia bacterium]
MLRQEAVADVAQPAIELHAPPIARGWLARVRVYLALTKPRIIVLLLVTTVPAMILAEGGMPSLLLIAITLLGGTLAAGGANAINCYFDRDIDGIMARTRDRPLPAGTVEPTRALVFGLALGVIAFAILTLGANIVAASLAIAALAFYVLVYTLWLKRSTTQNIVIGGAAGAMPPLVGWAAVTGGLDWAALVMFGIIFLWTPPHFWALALRYRGDYARAGVPMLPAVRGVDETKRQILLYSVVLVASTFLLIPTAGLGIVYFASALLLGGAFVGLAFRLWREPTPSASRALFLYSLIYLAALFVAMGADELLPL